MFITRQGVTQHYQLVHNTEIPKDDLEPLVSQGHRNIKKKRKSSKKLAAAEKELEQAKVSLLLTYIIHFDFA